MRKLDKMHSVRIARYLQEVIAGGDPRQFGKALTGDKKGLWRYRVEKYRILCRIEDDELVILVVEVGKRDSIYD